MRSNYFILCLLILFVAQNGILRAQTPPDPTADQLMQMMRSQPTMDISAPVTATAMFDPPLIQPGEKAIYRVTFNATAVSVNWPEKIPAPSGLKIQLNASGQTMLPVGAGFQNFATFDYDVRASAQGHFVMRSFAVQIYGKQVMVPEAELEVQENLLPAHEFLRQLVVEPATTNVYIGQIFDVNVRLDATTTGLIEGVSDVQFNGGGFVADKNTARQTVRMTDENGRRVMSYFYETGLTPLATGKLNLSAQGFTARMQPGGGETQILLDSEPVAINVRPLPTENELPGFNGLVGRYLCDPPNLATNVLVAGEPVELTVIIRGRENLKRVVPPSPPRAEGWQIFPAERSGIMADANGPGVKFKYTLIPLTEEISTTPVIPFSCFDPESESYLDLTIPSLPVTIIPGSTTNNDTALISADDSIDPETKMGLSKLAMSPGWMTGELVPWQSRGWFLPAQIFLALTFGGLWFYDRRRRWLEQHPEIVRRRAAKRALRREIRLLDGAEAKKDSADFIRRAINALQIVCAPHYPAAPRALVCGDVLEILTSAERAGKSGGTVRRFFAAFGAAAFADSSPVENDLFAEKSALKETLKILEALL
jgi:hypothetical protein